MIACQQSLFCSFYNWGCSSLLHGLQARMKPKRGLKRPSKRTSLPTPVTQKPQKSGSTTPLQPTPRPLQQKVVNTCYAVHLVLLVHVLLLTFHALGQAIQQMPEQLTGCAQGRH